MALYFECRINKTALLLFFGDFAYWVEFDDELYAYIRYVCTEFFAV